MHYSMLPVINLAAKIDQCFTVISEDRSADVVNHLTGLFNDFSPIYNLFLFWAWTLSYCLEIIGGKWCDLSYSENYTKNIGLKRSLIHALNYTGIPVQKDHMILTCLFGSHSLLDWYLWYTTSAPQILLLEWHTYEL